MTSQRRVFAVAGLAAETMARLLIADHHAAAIAGYRQFFRLEPIITKVVAVSTEEQILAHLADAPWDLLLLEIQRRDGDGIDLLRRLHAWYPDLRTLVVSGLPEFIYAPSALRGGARGYLSKSASAEELLGAVRRVLSGEKYFSEAVLGPPTGVASNPRVLPHETLSFRERQVFRRLGAGEQLTHIAMSLQLSVKTISTYRTRILEKMGLSSNADIVAYIARHKITQ